MLLNVHSYYSLRYGTLSLEQIIRGMQACGYDNAVLTDINNSSAVLDFVRLCRDAGLNGLAGMEFRNGDELLYIGIAKNMAGFKEFNELMTECNQKKIPLPENAPQWDNVFAIYPYGKKKPETLRENEYIGIRPSERNKVRLASSINLERYVILSPVSFHRQDGFTLHRQLRAIDHNILFSQLGPGQTSDADEVFISKVKLMELYKDFPQLIRNTNSLIQQCSLDFDFRAVRNKKSFTGNPYDDRLLLEKYTRDGLVRRYGKNDPDAVQRVRHELDIIDKLDFAAYFLITDDICRYARNRDFFYIGRGSGGNSVVAYCLGITEVDPIALDLYFERFLNPRRKTPPDFDVDFCWNQRDEMYDYIFKRYGSNQVALMGAMSTFKDKSILRELGKIYGLPKAEIDRMVRYPSDTLNQNEVVTMILSVYNKMADFPNQRTIHSSGVLISEEPLTCYTALDYPPKGLPTAQFDMYTAEEIGFEKFDILSQRGIGHIRDCVDIIAENRGEKVDITKPKQFFTDPNIAAQLKSANSIGCFYIESPAMRQLLTKLDCDNYLTLVAASSIIRPGVASSGMMKAYIERHHDPSEVQYLHPVFKEQLEETYGVMVYQEDVMKIGHHYGGLDLAEADVLRRMMSGKSRNKNLLLEIEDKFFFNCMQKGYPETVSREIWRQMESFAGYSFNKAHSASYAVESYQSLFLKTYYPIEFMTAVLNNYGGFYSRKVYVNEARKSGATIHLPDVNRSGYGATLYGTDIYLGFDCLQNLEYSLAIRIVEERKVNGAYTGLENFTMRMDAGLEQLIVLIRCGAFRFTGTGKKELLWEAHLLLSGKKDISSNGNQLFEADAKKPVLPKLDTSVIEDLYDEIELLGFPVTEPFFSLAKSGYRGDCTARELLHKEGQTVRMVLDFVCDKTVHTKNGKYMKFGTFFDVNGDFVDTVHFPPSLATYPLHGNGLYLVEGKVVLDFGCPAIEVVRCGKMPLKRDPRSA